MYDVKRGLSHYYFLVNKMWVELVTKDNGRKREYWLLRRI